MTTTLTPIALPRRLAVPAIILLSSLMGVLSTPAQTSSGAPKEQVKVVAHLPLEDMRVNQMFIQVRGSKVYLYLHRPKREVFALVDVTNPDRPVLLSRDVLKEAPGSQVEPPQGGSVLAIAVTPEGGPAHLAPTAVHLPTETVQFVDMSEPKNAKTLKTFKGVTSVYPDDARKLVYLVNQEGLWIVGHHMIRPMPLCTSEDSLNPVPECQ